MINELYRFFHLHLKPKPVIPNVILYSVIVLTTQNLITGCSSELLPLGENEVIRIYTEFADGSNRGMYDAVTGDKGLPDEDYDATTAMVINWHRLPESESERNARLRYRKVHPSQSNWQAADGESFDFWHRDEVINRVVLTGLQPGSVYEIRLTDTGEVFRIRTLPESLDERPVKIILTADHQRPSWDGFAHDNAKMATLQKPDMFVVAGDYVNDEGEVTQQNADRWATYLDYLYGTSDGYFHYDKEIDGLLYENLIIPHVSILGNHETGQRNHLRWPADLLSGAGPGYQEYVAANWMELLFHWPYSSEGFYSEFNPSHPNMASESLQEGFGRGGFGKLSFSDYLLLIALDSSQNWEGQPDRGLRDWQGELITDKWPWYETHHAEVRQDVWLKNLLEPQDEPSAGEVYTHVLPVWHRGLFGTVRQNMSLKNRDLLKYWLPVLYRNGAKLIKEAHDHSYARTIPMHISSEQPENTYLEKVHYEPNTWELTDNLPHEYIDDFFSVNCLMDEQTGEIVGWEYQGNYITYGTGGMIAIGHGGWAAGRRDKGHWGGGNAGLWFVDEVKGGGTLAGEESFHINIVHLSNEDLTVEAFHPDQLPNFEQHRPAEPIHRFRWNIGTQTWQAWHSGRNVWVRYEDFLD